MSREPGRHPIVGIDKQQIDVLNVSREIGLRGEIDFSQRRDWALNNDLASARPRAESCNPVVACREDVR
jgi:hypothetical protein